MKSPTLSVESARAAYPILIQFARDLAAAVREKRMVAWVSYDDLCARCKDAGIKETPRTVMTKLLRPIQVACLERDCPDLSALFIQKPKARGDFGNLIRPSDGWWETYVQRGEATVGDVSFWFKRYQAARDFADWPEVPFF